MYFLMELNFFLLTIYVKVLLFNKEKKAKQV